MLRTNKKRLQRGPVRHLSSAEARRQREPCNVRGDSVRATTRERRSCGRRCPSGLMYAAWHARGLCADCPDPHVPVERNAYRRRKFASAWEQALRRVALSTRSRFSWLANVRTAVYGEAWHALQQPHGCKAPDATPHRPLARLPTTQLTGYATSRRLGHEWHGAKTLAHPCCIACHMALV